MVGIVIAGHGQFATGLLSSLRLIAGDFANVAAVDFEMQNSIEELSEKLGQAVQNFTNCDKVIFFTDLAGGSPFRCSVLEGRKTAECKVIAGTNLPMVLEVLFARDSLEPEALQKLALATGKQGIQCFADEGKARQKNGAAGI